MKSYILILMLLSIISLIIKERRRFKSGIDLLIKMEVKRLVYIIGSTYLVIALLLSISSPTHNSIYLVILFILGAIYILYASSKHFDKINIIRIIEKLVEETQIPNSYKLKLSNDLEIKYNIGKRQSMIKVQELLDDKGNILFQVINFEFIRRIAELWAEKNIEKDSIPHFMNLLAGKKIAAKIMLISKAEKSHDFTYRPLFELFNKITFLGIKKLVLDHRRMLLHLICLNFNKQDENISYQTLNSRFSTWRKA